MRAPGRSAVVWLVLAVSAAAGAVPASAQVLLSGNWTSLRTHEDEQDRGPGPDLGDYTGIPINDAARLFAESWDASRLTLQEHQCRVHVAPYIYHGPLNLRIWEEKDPETQRVIAFKHYISTYEQTRTIWMDERPHPSLYAPHTFMGFSTGRWEGNALVVTTTHLKQGWLRRNGVPESDQTTMVEHFIRRDKYLTHVATIWDPVYLTEPMIRTSDFVMATEDSGNWLWPCDYVQEILDRPRGEVPHHLPGENPFMQEFADRTGVPLPATRGGAGTIYPEYRRALETAGGALPDADTAPRVSQAPNPDTGAIEVLPVQGNLYLLAGGGGNVAVQIGPSGVLLVDAKPASLTDAMLAAIETLAGAGKRIRYLLNTSADPDHAGGNEGVAAVAGSATNWNIINTPGGSLSEAVRIFAHDNVLSRMTHLPNTAWPTETYVGSEKEFFFNGEPVFMHHVPAAHTDGDSLVFFRRSDVVVTGDIFRTDGYPVIDLERGGGIQGVIDGLNRVLDLAVPAHHEEGGTFVVPGHGRIADEFDVLEYRDMVTIVRDRIQAMIDRGMSLEQVQAARPTRDYDPRYGADSASGGLPAEAGIGSAVSEGWTTAMFVEAVYRDLRR